MLPETTFRRSWLIWAPALILALGVLALQTVKRQVAMPLVQPLNTTMPDSLVGLAGADQVIGADELRVSGVSDYLYRAFRTDSGRVQLTIYVGYYEAQSRGKSIHSPKNCLPGAGWEPLESSVITIDAGGYRFTANRYVLENQGRRVLAYYWYQGRGRIASNEYWVKWEQIRDRALAGRSDEALVRIIVPITPSFDMGRADAMATQVSQEIVRPIYASLPPFPSRSIPGLPMETVGRADSVTGGLLPRKS